jgi:hypothetical protein
VPGACQEPGRQGTGRSATDDGHLDVRHGADVGGTATIA